MAKNDEPMGGIPRGAWWRGILSGVIVYAGMMAYSSRRLESVSWADLLGVAKFSKVFFGLSALYFLLSAGYPWFWYRVRFQKGGKLEWAGFCLFVGAMSMVLVRLDILIQIYANKLFLVLE